MFFNFIVAVHVLFWVYMLFGSFWGPRHAAIILFWLVPITWLVHILPFHILGQYEERELGIQDMDKHEKMVILNKAVCDIFPFLRPWFDVQELCEVSCYGNPIGGQGMLILSAILASRVLIVI